MIWLTGSQGLLGSAFARIMREQKIGFLGTGSELDLCNKKLVEEFVSNNNFICIINCAAYTNVERAEEDLEHALSVNRTALQNITKAIGDKVLVIHYSTDYVFNGNKIGSYNEEDTTNPISTYGVSKLAGEKMLQIMHPNSFVFRISWLYGQSDRNFVCKILNKIIKGERILVVSDQVGCPTYADDIVEKTLSIMNMSDIPYGIYHLQDQGQISWYDLACKINDLALKIGFTKEKCEIIPVSSSSFETLAKRPANSLLDTSKIETETGIIMNHWERNLETFLNLLHGTTKYNTSIIL